MPVRFNVAYRTFVCTLCKPSQPQFALYFVQVPTGHTLSSLAQHVDGTWLERDPSVLLSQVSLPFICSAKRLILGSFSASPKPHTGGTFADAARRVDRCHMPNKPPAAMRVVLTISSLNLICSA